MSPWSSDCVMQLARALAVRDMPAIGEWMEEHVGTDGHLWEQYALTLVGLAASGIDEHTKAAVGDEPIVFVPGDVDTGEHVDKLALQMLAMYLNEDFAGMAGVLAAVREADDITSLCGALAATASRSLAGQVVRIETLP